MGFFCEVCNKQYTRTTKIKHDKTKIHSKNLKNTNINVNDDNNTNFKELNDNNTDDNNTNFKELNDNLPEYNLIPLIINFSGKQNCLYDRFEKLSKDYNGYFFYEELYKKEKLSIEFIKEFKDVLFINHIFENYKTMGFNILEFVREFYNDFNWYDINKNLKNFGFDNIQFVREFKHKLCWKYMTKKLKIYDFNTIDFVREFKDELKWDIITGNLKIFGFNNIEFIKEFQDKLDWEVITRNLKFFEFNYNEFVRKFSDKLYWSIMYTHLKKNGFNNIGFKYEFIDKFQLYNREKILKSYKININLLRKYKDKFSYYDWGDISKKLKEYNLHNFFFVNEFKDYIVWDNVDDDIFNQFKNFIPRKYILIKRYQK